ncbi:hypothetical protein BDA96_08G101600 [Sorghum bicolor]|uniref:Uncharacterized protein n=1 Tax=Sorghum bicolor TaxID=4558 RepID=A0A921QF83_SORBI|nr:hypothetical protein BDA96_08G101600 [Sorghum bicolor]
MQSCQDLYDYACQVFEDLQPAPSGTKQLTSHCHTRFHKTMVQLTKQTTKQLHLVNTQI